MRRQVFSVALVVSCLMVNGVGQTAGGTSSDHKEAQATLDRNMANAKVVTARMEKEKTEKALHDPTHDGRVPVVKGNVSVGGTIEKGGASVNVRVSEPAPPAAPKSAPAATPAAAAPDHTRPLIDRPSPDRTKDFVGPDRGSEKVGRTA